MLLTLTPPTDVRKWAAVTGFTQAAAARHTGGLSAPGKMPCHSYGLPAAECNVGGRLQKVENTTCSNCYALKGSYRMYPEVFPAQYRRLASVKLALTSEFEAARWVAAMVTLIGWRERESGHFRWHDAGDLIPPDRELSITHLDLLVRVAEALPWVEFWCPTREARTIRDWITENGPLPANLTMRESVPMVNRYPRTDRDDGRVFSGVTTEPENLPDTASLCPAYTQNGECRDCRNCWNSDTPLIVYPLH